MMELLEGLINLEVLFVAVVGTLALTLFVGFRLFNVVGKVRRESKRADDIARQIQEEWEAFNRNQSESIRRKLTDVDQRAATLEEKTAGRIHEFEALVEGTRRQVQRLEEYLRDVFEVELKNTFDAFDSTVTGVLAEMKNELMRGVDRIEEIQSMVESRDAVEGRLADSRDAVQSLTGEDLELEPQPEPPAADEAPGEAEEQPLAESETGEESAPEGADEGWSADEETSETA